MKKFSLFVSAAFLIVIISCTKDSTSNCSTTTVSYSGFIAPLMSTSCNSSGCHNAASKAGGHQFTTYAGVKEAVNHGHFYSEMASGSMPVGGTKLPDSILVKVKSWVDACAPNN